MKKKWKQGANYICRFLIKMYNLNMTFTISDSTAGKYNNDFSFWNLHFQIPIIGFKCYCGHVFAILSPNLEVELWFVSFFCVFLTKFYKESRIQNCIFKFSVLSRASWAPKKYWCLLCPTLLCTEKPNKRLC